MAGEIVSEPDDRPTPDSREAMLDAAWRIVVESFGFSSGDDPRQIQAKILEQLKAAEIANRAGLTTGAFYNRWSNRAAFLEDFLDYALSVDRSPTLTRMLELSETMAGRPYLERTMILAEADLATVAANPAFAIQTHLWSLMRSRHDIQARMANMYRDFRQPMNGLFETLLEDMAREIRPPFTLDQFSNALVALAEGFTMQSVAGGEASPDGEVFGWTILALVPIMTRPIGEEEDLLEIVARLMPE